MKTMKYILVLALVVLGTTTASAQAYTESKYYNQNTGRLDYSGSYGSKVYDEDYYGFRIGAGFCTVSGDNKELNGSGLKTGLDIGFVYGMRMAYNTPLYLETGLSYIEKGGNGTRNKSDIKYNLNYLEVPFVAKYVYDIDSDFSIQPYLGGYLALGVGGKIKDYDTRTSYSSFGSKDNQFQRFDGGIKLGCGFGYDLFYGEVGYEFGLSNIYHDEFDSSSNSALTLTVGVNF